MKIIISHDVDHMTVWEHLFKDLILPKFIVRNILELLVGKITLKQFFHRHGDLFTNKWQRIEEVMNYNKSMGFTSTFFIGVNNGVGLSYPLHHVKKWVPIIRKRGFEAGVHGIDFDAYDKVKKEFEIFKEIFGSDNFGIRMHYLRATEDTYTYLEKSGYKYETTREGFENPFKTGDMWNFPLQIMDGWALGANENIQSSTLEEAKEYTIAQLKKAKQHNLKYCSILFHDRYFSSSFQNWKDWYVWLIEYLKAEGYEFISYQNAIKELEQE